MQRKYKHLEIKVKSTPFIGRGKGIFVKASPPPMDMEGKPCTPGHTEYRDGCIPEDGEHGNKRDSDPIPKKKRTAKTPVKRHAFDSIKTGESSTFEAYHWTIVPVNKWKLKDSPIFITDDPDTWKVEEGNKRTFNVTLENPFVLTTKGADNLESVLTPKMIRLLRSNGYDSIVWIPHNQIVGDRQALLLKPKKQIKEV